MSKGKSFVAFKRKWIELNPPNEQGFYECWLCHKPVHISTFTMDHVLSQAEYPEYAREMSNIRPAHGFCNEQRGQKVKQVKRYGSSSLKKRFKYNYHKKLFKTHD